MLMELGLIFLLAYQQDEDFLNNKIFKYWSVFNAFVL